MLPSISRLADNLWTGNDVLHRDPVSWTLEMRTTEGDWAAIDAQNDLTPPAERLAPYMPIETNFFVPETSIAKLNGWTGRTSTFPPPPPPPPPPPLPRTPTRRSAPPYPPAHSPSALVLQPQTLPTATWNTQGPLDPQAPTVDTFAVDSQSSGDANSVPTAVVILALPFLIIALVNVVYVWRKLIGKALKSLLTAEQYAALLAQLEIQRGTGPWEWAAARLQYVHTRASDAWARWRGNGFTRVASSRPLEGMGNFYDETDFSVDITSSCDWGSKASSAPLPSAVNDGTSESSDEEDHRNSNHDLEDPVPEEPAEECAAKPEVRTNHVASNSEEPDGSDMHVVV